MTSERGRSGGGSGWQPLGPALRPAGAGFVTSPFTKLARTHALSSAGDTLVALALAGSLFFDISPDQARWKVALYLLLTMAPFSVVSPLIGPAIDRLAGGRRLMVVVSGAGRAVVCALMVGHIDSLFLFPEAFTGLVLSKAYAVSKSALVPTVVADDAELVEANSKLVLISGVLGFVAAVPGGILLLIGPGLVLGLAAVVFGVAVIMALQMDKASVAPEPAGTEERAELRSAGIVVAASAMALLRGMVGFLTFLVAFTFRRNDVATAWFGVVLASSGIGSLCGAGLAPVARRHVREEKILIGVLFFAAFVAALAATDAGTFAACVMAFAAGLASSCGKLAFDAIVQRDAPDANRGRSFARFETRFQLVWVVGAFAPVVLPIPATIGYITLALLSAFAAGSYVAGLRAIERHGHAPETLLKKVARRAERSGWTWRTAPGRIREAYSVRKARRPGTGAPAGPAPAPPALPAPPHPAARPAHAPVVPFGTDVVAGGVFDAEAGPDGEPGAGVEGGGHAGDPHAGDVAALPPPGAAPPPTPALLPPPAPAGPGADPTRELARPAGPAGTPPGQDQTLPLEWPG